MTDPIIINIIINKITDTVFWSIVVICITYYAKHVSFRGKIERG